MSKIDGIILTGDNNKANAFLQACKKNLPVVLTDMNDVQYFNYITHDVAVFDIIGAMNVMIGQIADSGRRQIAYIGDPLNHHLMSERRMAYRHACVEHGLTADLTSLDLGSGDCNIHDTLYARLTAMEELPSAIICENDSIAVELVDILSSMGKQVPEDICVAGFDCSDDMTAMEKGFATTVYSREDLGFSAVELLAERIKHPNSPYLMLRQRAKILNNCMKAAH